MSNTRGECTSCHGDICVQCIRRENMTALIRPLTSRTKSDCYKTTNIIITLLLAGWLLPTVNSAASQNETRAKSSNWSSTGSDPLDKQTSNIPPDPSRSVLPLPRRGDNQSPTDNISLTTVSEATTQHVILESNSRNISKETSEKSAVSANTGPQQEDNMSKIISIVVPFSCVIFVAGTLCATYQLCHKYRCYRNKAGLTKCLTFCDRCMSTPHVFHMSEDKKDMNRISKVSNDSGRLFRYSFHSVSSSSSVVSSTPPPLTNNTQRHAGLAPAAQYTPLRHSSSSSSQSSLSMSGQAPRSPSRRPGSVGVGRQNSAISLASNPGSIRSTAGNQSPRHPETKADTPGLAQRSSLYLSRQPITPGLSRASVRSQGSLQLPPQPHKAPGGISRRHNSVR